MQKLTQKRLKKILKYKKKKGILIWRIPMGNRRIGYRAGGKEIDGYRSISINRIRYKEHRLIFLYMLGYIPEHEIDHLNGIKDDNRWKNLREVSTRCNHQNSCISINNKSGFPGVHRNTSRKKYYAQITINDKLHYIGAYDNKLEAALARFTAEVNCPDWTCDHRSELSKAIKKVWPEFRPKRCT